MSLETGKKVHGFQWTELAITDEVVDRVHVLAEEQKVKFLDDHGAPKLSNIPGHNLTIDDTDVEDDETSQEDILYSDDVTVLSTSSEPDDYSDSDDSTYEPDDHDDSDEELHNDSLYNYTPDVADIIANDKNADEGVRSGDEKPSVELRSESVELRSEAGAEVEVEEISAASSDDESASEYNETEEVTEDEEKN